MVGGLGGGARLAGAFPGLLPQKGGSWPLNALFTCDSVIFLAAVQLLIKYEGDGDFGKSLV